VAEETGIGWTDHTLPGWRGCAKVSAGCKHCYAEHSTPVRAARAGEEAKPRREVVRKGKLVVLPARPAKEPIELWGADGARIEGKNWESDLRKWNAAALRDGVRRRVFALALGDVFEDYQGGRVLRADGRVQPTLDGLRRRMLDALANATGLDVQLVTKRPENVETMVPLWWWKHEWPRHVWMICSCENQEEAEVRLPHLLRIPAPVLGVSVEPMLGPMDLSDLVRGMPVGEHHYSALACDVDAEDDQEWGGRSVSWVICGGESPQGGRAARPFDWSWAESLKAQCEAAGAPFHMKQGPNGETDEATFPVGMRGCRAFPMPRASTSAVPQSSLPGLAE
jgi:protein gp37